MRNLDFDNQPDQGNISVHKPFVKPANEEIIIKCSIEEMVKAFFKDYVIIWHDPSVNNQENQQYIAQLREFCEVFTFTEWDKAKDYIQGTQAICHVISSGTNGELLIKEIFGNENVCNIYIFCENKEYHSSWAKDFATKVSCIETSIQNLINQIQQNLLGWYKKASSLNLSLPAFAPIFNDSDKSEMNHLHRYLKIIPNFKNREQAKDDFMRLSRKIYSDRKNTELLEEFEEYYNEYDKEKTLKWYTRECFLYKVTNNCLRIATSDSIQYCRLLLKDIEQAIKDQYHTKSKNFNGLLYRGAYLSDIEWSNLKENLDKEIEIHGFLSVSKKRGVALKFMQNDPSKKVLITILVPKGSNEEEQGFAEMEDFSRFPKEQEILFNVRSRFTVLETEDDYAYSGTSKCRHLVLFYGAQGFRKFIAEENPIQEVSIQSMDSISCTHCHVKNERLLFVSIAGPENQDHYYCKTCIHYGVAPFLCVPSKNKVDIAKIQGCLLMMNSSDQQTPFYGYKCCNCQAKKQEHYFICTDCYGKKWCENCSEENLTCLAAGHNILLETSPFSFWCEKMSTNELIHLRFQNDSIQYSGDVFQQAQMYYESHEYEKALEYYSLYIKENEPKDKDYNLAISYNNLGTVYHEQGEYKKALEYHLKSLDIRKSIYGNDHSDIASCYNNIGCIYDDQGEYKEALEYYLRSLEIRQSLDLEENHPDIAASYNNIGSVYHNQGEYKKALEYLLKALNIQKFVHGGDNHPLVATSYNNVGLVYDNQGDSKRAFEYFLKALDIRKSVYGDNHPDTASSYNTIGLAYYAEGEYTKALEHYLKSLDIRKSVYGGESHPEVATSFNTIGGVYGRQGEYGKALEYFLKALDIRKSVYEGENHSSVATSYNNIGGVYNDQGEYGKALEYFLKALDIRKCIYEGESHRDVAHSYNNIASVYHDQGDNEKALEYYSKSRDIQKSIYGGDNHPEIAGSYSNTGLVYYNQGEYTKALESYLKRSEIEKFIHEGENHLSVASCYNTIGLIYYKQEEYDKSLEYYSKSLEIQKIVYGEDDHIDIATAYNNIGMIYKNQGESQKALEYSLKALDVHKSVYGGDDHPEFAISYSNVALVYDNLGEYKKALEYYLKSLDLFKTFYGDDHSYTIQIQDLVLKIQPTHQKELQ